MPDFFVRGPSQPPLRPRPWGRAHAAPPAPLSPKARQRGASFQPEYPPSPLPILLLFIFTILGGGAGRALSAAAVREKPGRRAGPAPRSQGGRGGSAMRERGGGGEGRPGGTVLGFPPAGPAAGRSLLGRRRRSGARWGFFRRRLLPTPGGAGEGGGVASAGSGRLPEGTAPARAWGAFSLPRPPF